MSGVCELPYVCHYCSLTSASISGIQEHEKTCSKRPKRNPSYCPHCGHLIFTGDRDHIERCPYRPKTAKEVDRERLKLVTDYLVEQVGSLGSMTWPG